MEQAETIEVMGMTCVRNADDGGSWRATYSSTRSDDLSMFDEDCIMLFQEQNCEWRILLTCSDSRGGAKVSLHGTGATPADAAADALSNRGAVDAAVRRMDARLAMLDAGEVAA